MDSQGNFPILSRDALPNLYERDIVDVRESERDKGRNYLRTHIVLYLNNTNHADKLGRQILEIIDRSVQEIPGWDPSHGEEAFLALEKYALNVLDCDWKQEFRRVKLYGGYYQVKISACLIEVINVFLMMGYRQDTALQELVMDCPASREELIFVACECFVASVECFLMRQILLKCVDNGYNLQDVYRSRVQHVGDVGGCTDWINIHCKSPPKRSQKEQDKALKDYDKEKEVCLQNDHCSINEKTDWKSSNLVVSMPPVSNGKHLLRTKSEDRGNSSLHKEKKRDSGYESKPVSKEIELPPAIPPRQKNHEVQHDYGIDMDDFPPPPPEALQPYGIGQVVTDSEPTNEIGKSHHTYKGSLIGRGQSHTKDSLSTTNNQHVYPNHSMSNSPYGSSLSHNSDDLYCASDDATPEEGSKGKRITVAVTRTPAVTRTQTLPCDSTPYSTDRQARPMLSKQRGTKSAEELSNNHVAFGSVETTMQGVRDMSLSKGQSPDVYETGTMEDHLQRSLQAVQHINESNGDYPPTKSQLSSNRRWGSVSQENIDLHCKDTYGHRDFCQTKVVADVHRPLNFPEQLPSPADRKRVEVSVNAGDQNTGHSPYENVEEMKAQILARDSSPDEDSSDMFIRRKDSFKGVTFGKSGIYAPEDGYPYTNEFSIKGATSSKIASSRLPSLPASSMPERHTIHGYYRKHSVDADTLLEEDEGSGPLTQYRRGKTPLSRIDSNEVYSGESQESGVKRQKSASGKAGHPRYIQTSSYPQGFGSLGSLETEDIHSLKKHADLERGLSRSESVNGMLKPWRCGACTYHNKANSSICEICSKSRLKGSEDVPLCSGGRLCPKCTLVNEVGFSTCQACGEDLRKASTYC